MPSREKAYVYSVIREKEEFSELLLELFTEDCLVLVEDLRSPDKFGTDKIPASIEFPGFIFDSTKEVRWYINDCKFFVTIISDEPIQVLSEIEGTWTRERVAEYVTGPEKNKGDGVYLVDPDSLHLNIISETLRDYISQNKILENSELFSRNGVPTFLTLRRPQ